VSGKPKATCLPAERGTPPYFGGKPYIFH